MALIEFNLEHFGNLKGGLLALMVNKALAKIATDVDAAPDVKAARTVTIKLILKPVHDQVVAEFEVSHKVPPRITSAVMDVRANAQGQRLLFFQEDAPDNPSQTTLYDSQPSEGGHEDD